MRLNNFKSLALLFAVGMQLTIACMSRNLESKGRVAQLPQVNFSAHCLGNRPNPLIPQWYKDGWMTIFHKKNLMAREFMRSYQSCSGQVYRLTEEQFAFGVTRRHLGKLLCPNRCHSRIHKPT